MAAWGYSWQRVTTEITDWHLHVLLLTSYPSPKSSLEVCILLKLLSSYILHEHLLLVWIHIILYWPCVVTSHLLLVLLLLVKSHGIRIKMSIWTWVLVHHLRYSILHFLNCICSYLVLISHVLLRNHLLRSPLELSNLVLILHLLV